MTFKELWCELAKDRGINPDHDWREEATWLRDGWDAAIKAARDALADEMLSQVEDPSLTAYATLTQLLSDRDK